MKSWLKHAQPVLLASLVAAGFAACDEQLDSGMACPALCPQQQLAVHDTTLIAADLDTSIAGFPTIGRELQLYLAAFGDTLDTRGVVRFDTLEQTFRHNNSAVDSNIVSVDTGAIVRFTVIRGDTLGPSGTVELYDVDLDGAEDADPTAVVGAFTPDRFLGARDFTARDSLLDVPIDPDKLLAKIQAAPPANRLRVGVRLTGATSTHVTLLTTNGNAGGEAPTNLIFRPSAGDTSVALRTVTPRSLTPTDQPFLAADLIDYLVVAKAPPEAPADVVRVGGLPARRVYMHFAIPSHIIDSSNIVRATLLLTQRPAGFSPTSTDTVTVQPFALSASPEVTDLPKALQFIVAPPGSDSLRVVPADSGRREIEVVRIVKLWGATTEDQTPRALVLRSARESETGILADFFSLEAADALRPRLRITYLPRATSGLP